MAFDPAQLKVEIDVDSEEFAEAVEDAKRALNNLEDTYIDVTVNPVGSED